MPAEPKLENNDPNRPSQAMTASAPAHRSGPPELWITPTHIGPYVVRRLIDSGGMGSVYECYDEHLKAVVAVKVAHPELATRPDVLEQIRSEAQRLASVRDKTYICRVLSAGDVVIGGATVPYVAMEYEPDAETMGGPISNAWSMQRKVAFFVKVCAAVSGLHEQYLVHADIKPSNILVVKGEPRLIDFGIARLVRHLGGERGQPVAGTPGYFDPAVLADSSRAPDQRSDIYALGMTLAEFLSGRPPEVADGYEAGTPPTWPSVERPPSRTNPGIDRELDGIILRAIDPNPSPGRRFQSVEELAGRLSSWQSFHRSLPARVGEAWRGWTRSAVLLFVRSRVIGTATLALVVASVSLFCTPLLFHWTSLGALTQVVPASVSSINHISNVRVIDGSDYTALGQACEKLGVRLDMGDYNDRRLAWALLARKLASAGPIRAVGFDLFFIQSFPADQTLKDALLALADRCESKSVVLAVDEWHNTVSPELREPGRIHVATSKIIVPIASQPPNAHLALRRAGSQGADASFALAVAGVQRRPESGMTITYNARHDAVRLTFQHQSASGAWLRSSADEVTLSGQTIRAPTDDDGPVFADGDMLAKIPVFTPTDAAIAECRKSASEILAMSTEALREWIGSRSVIVVGKEPMLSIGGRAVSPAILVASVVESLATLEVVRFPGPYESFGITLLAAFVGAIFGWCALGFWSRCGRRLLPMWNLVAIALGVATTSLGCFALIHVAMVYVNPMVPCLAVTLAVVAVAFLGRARSAHLGTDL